MLRLQVLIRMTLFNRNLSLVPWQSSTFLSPRLRLQSIQSPHQLCYVGRIQSRRWRPWSFPRLLGSLQLRRFLDRRARVYCYVLVRGRASESHDPEGYQVRYSSTLFPEFPASDINDTSSFELKGESSGVWPVCLLFLDFGICAMYSIELLVCLNSILRPRYSLRWYPHRIQRRGFDQRYCDRYR